MYNVFDILIVVSYIEKVILEHISNDTIMQIFQGIRLH